MATLCRIQNVPRSSTYYRPETEPALRPRNPQLTALIGSLIQQFHAFGVRRIWAWRNQRLGHQVNRKTVHRVMCQRRRGQRPRVEAFPSVA